MKKLLALMLAAAMLLCGCMAKTNEEFKEVEKVDLEVSDYVEGEEKIEENKETEIKEEKPVENKEEVVKQEEKEPVKEDTKKEEKPQAKPAEKSPEPVKVDYASMNLNGKVICIDAAHGTFTENVSEPVAPNSDVMKDGFKEGTKGVNVKEDTITLAVANILKEKLEAKGAKVIMTRTDEVSNLSNKDRALFANDNGAFICIKLHADGTNDGGSGMTMLVPGNKYIADKEMLSISKKLGKTIINGAVAKTGAVKNPTIVTNEMTGFNWSKIPVVLLEMGYLTNPDDEKKLADSNYQSLIADGIVEGILEYYR